MSEKSESKNEIDPEGQDIRILVQISKKKDWNVPNKRRSSGKQISPETYNNAENLVEVIDTIKMEIRSAIQKCLQEG
jgi:HD-GYP domain-containing protein (c-di-GMP phosphodiesterase class II)